MDSLTELERQVVAAIDAAREELVGLSRTQHANPELGFREYKSSALLCDALQAHGLVVTRGLGTLETAFRAEAQGGAAGPTIALLAEYDALPDIGHACGHNLMGTACVGAAIGLRQVLEQVPGKLVVIGTPAEEGGGGKIMLLEQGALEGIDAAMLVHPSARTMVARGSLASNRLKLEFHGKASHAAGAPTDGINALEAVIQTFVNVNGARLHMKEDARVHGIITSGGSAVNIIPDYAAALFSIRATHQPYADELLRRVIACAQAAALSTGARLDYTVIRGYAEMVVNRALAGAFADRWRALGVHVDEPRTDERMGSTDMGNVSQALPAIHPYIQIAPDGTAGHTVEFREAAISEAGLEGMIQSAKGMALTTLRLLTDPALLGQVQAEFQAWRRG